MVLNQVKEELFYLLLTLVTHKKRVTGVPDFCFDQVHCTSGIGWQLIVSRGIF